MHRRAEQSWMNRVSWKRIAPTVALLAVVAVPLHTRASATTAVTHLPSNVTVLASGLNNPRGLAFSPNGNLYVAEAGIGGTQSTVGQCGQVPPPLGPYSGGNTARISRISSNGTRSTLVDNLPSSVTTKATGGDVLGVAAVAFNGNMLYALIAGAGCSHGNAGSFNQIMRVRADGSTVTVANLSAFLQVNPVASPDPGDYEPDGTWYSLVANQGNFYVAEPNHQEIDQVSPQGMVSRILDLSAIYPGNPNWQGPTSLAFHNGKLYVGYLNPFPAVVGASHVDTVDLTGKRTMIAAGLTAVVAVAFRGNQLYVLEMATVPGLPGPNWAGKGMVVRVTPAGTLRPVATGLTFPTGMAFGPDGSLYISNNGVGPAGAGEIVRANVG